MKTKWLFPLLLILAAAAGAHAQGNGVIAITVTNAATTIVTDRPCNRVLVRENSASPTAVFSITLSGNSTAINFAAGTQYLIVAPGGSNWSTGTNIASIVATTAGPFTFAGVESIGQGSTTINNSAQTGSGGSTVYPGAGVGNSTGSAWATSYAVGTGNNDLVQLTSVGALPAVSGANLTNLPAPSGLTLANIAAGAAGTGTYDFSGVTLIKLRVGAGLATSANGDIGYDTTAGKWHLWAAAADSTLAPSAFTDTTNASNIASGTLSNARLPAPILIPGIVDGEAPTTATTGASCTLGTTSGCNATAYDSGYTFNQEATAGAAVTYTLPATAAGKQYCVANSIVSGTGAADTGVLTVYPPASSYMILKGVINTIGGGGTHGVASGGAAGDGACFVANDSTHWTVYVQSGTWTEN